MIAVHNVKPINRTHKTSKRCVIIFIAASIAILSRAVRADQGLVLVSEHKAAACISLYGEKITEPEEFAGNEIANYLDKISGAKLEVTMGEPLKIWRHHQVTGHFILISRCGNENNWNVPFAYFSSLLAGKKKDSFVIHSTAKYILLAGNNSRGVLYSVYAALEAIGVNFVAPRFEFYDHRNEIIPHLSTVIFPNIDKVESPGFEYRKEYIGPGFGMSATRLIELSDWMAKNRMNVIVASVGHQMPSSLSWDDYRKYPGLMRELHKRGIIIEVGGHGYSTFIPFQKYPEFYQSEDVFPCFSRKGVLSTYLNNVIGYLKSHPEIEIFDAWPPDGRKWCSGDIEMWKTPQNVQAHVITALNKEIKDQWPQVTVEMLSYAAAQQLPDIRIPSDVMVDFAAYDRSYESSLFDKTNDINDRFAAYLDAWADKTNFDGTLCYYSYYRKYSWNSRAVSLASVISDEVKTFYSKGISGLGSYSEPEDWITYELMHSLVAKLSWQPDLNANGYLDTYTKSRFGSASEYMKQYFKYVEDASRQLYYSPEGAYNSVNESDVRRLELAAYYYELASDSISKAIKISDNGSDPKFLEKRLEINLNYTMRDLQWHIDSAEGRRQAASKLDREIQAEIYAHKDEGVFMYPLYSEVIKQYRRLKKSALKRMH